MLPNVFKIFFAAILFFAINVSSIAQCYDFGISPDIEQKDACFGVDDGRISIKLFGGGAGTYDASNFALYLMVGFTETGPLSVTTQVFNGDSVVFSDLAPSEDVIPDSYYEVRFSDPLCVGGTPFNIYNSLTTPLVRNTEILANETVTEECSGNDGEILVAPSGGTGPYTLVWSNGPVAIPDNELNPKLLPAGTYDLTITDNIGCSNTFSFTIDPGPDATLSSTGATDICDGETSTIQVTINNGTSPYTVVIDTTGSGTNRTINNYNSGDDIIIGPTANVTYSLVSVVDANTCSASLTGTVDMTVNSLPTLFDVTGGGSYCAGSSIAQAIGLSGSELGINYILVRDGATDVETLPGTGAVLAFSAQTQTGTYTVRGESASTPCTADMNLSAVVSEEPLPTIFNVTGGGSYCAGSPVAQPIGLSSSELGVNYILVRDGATDVETIAGTGAVLAFTDQTQAGTYSVRAENASTSCTSDMNLSVEVIEDPLPTAFNVTGGGNYCVGSPVGQAIGLDNSEAGVNYILVRDGVTDVEIVVGTGSAIAFTSQTTVGNYTVRAESSAASCTTMMTGDATIGEDPIPIVYDVTGGGSYCAGSPVAQAIGLTGSESGVNYILVRDGATDVETVSGTGAALAFSTQTQIGTYTVRAENTTTSCTSTMNLNAIIAEDPLPTVFNVTGGGSYCAGSPLAQAIGLSSSELGVNYILVRDGATDVETVAGTGAVLSFSDQTQVGIYTVRAVNATTSCTSNMSLSAEVIEDPLPNAFNVTGGGNYCEGTPVAQAIGVDNSEAGINYILVRDGVTDVEIIAGTGTTIAFTPQTTVGTYTVRAESGAAVCTTDMNGNAVVIQNPKPSPITISGDNNPACQAPGIDYSVTGQAGSSYAWTIPPGATIVGSSDGPLITVNFGYNSGDITVVETSTDGCSGDQSTLNVTLQTCPFTADFNTDVTDVCIAGFVEFTDVSIAPIGTTYSWDFGVDANPATANTQGPHSVSYSSVGTKSITLTITYGTLSDNITKTINVTDLPTADLSGGATTCPGGSTPLTVNLTGTAPWDFTYNDGSTDITINISSSPHAFDVSPLVTTTFTPVSVIDALCSGSVSGSATVNVTPPKEVVIRLDSIVGAPGNSVKVPLRLIDYEDLMTMQFTVAWDPNLLNYTNVSDINLTNASLTNFGLDEVNNGFLTFSWYTGGLSDTTIVDSTAIFSIDFNVANTVCSDASVSIDESISALTPLEIVDENLCNASVTVKVGNVENQAIAQITSDDADNLICFGDQVLFTGLPRGMSTYDFYVNGVLVQSSGNNVYLNNTLVDQDSVNVIISDVNGCSLPAQGIINTVNQVVVTPTVTAISGCGLTDGSITLAVSGGSGTYSFNWSGPGITDPSLQDQANLSWGQYSVEITDDGSGCVQVLDTALSEPVSFTLGTTKTDVTSTGGSDGAIDLTIAGGTGPFDILWTGPNGFTSTVEDISGLFAGTYVGTITDTGEGCSDAVTVEILQPINAIVLNATKTDVSTCGAMDGAINLLILGGSGNYAISWTGPNGFSSNNQNLSGLEGGLYIATVVDLVTTLTAQWSVQIDVPEGFAVDAEVTELTYCDGNDGSITLNITGGSGDFAFAWRDLVGLGFTSTDKDVTDLELGVYRVVVTDNISGCKDSLDATVGRPEICDQPCALKVESTTNNTSCPDTEDGVAVINIISGGSGPGNYYVSLDTGKTFIPFEGHDITAIVDNGQGSYLYIVKDTVTGCTDQTIANVGVSTNLMANISTTNPGCDENDGMITFNISGGLVPFEVDIVDSLGNVTTMSGNGFFQFMDLTAGSYHYAVREQSGCTIVATDSVELWVDCQSGGCSSLVASAHSFEDATCGSDPNGKAIIEVTGGSSPYEYSVDGENWIPFISGNVVEYLPPNGTYNIVVRQDVENPDCRAEVSVTINGPELITMETPIITTQKATCNQNDGAVKVGRVTGGIEPYNYQIDGSFFTLEADSIITDLGVGIHTFSVIDGVSCQADFVFEVESPGVVVARTTDVPVSCTSIFLKAGIRIEVDLDSTTLPGPYDAYVASTSDPEGGETHRIQDNGILTILQLEKDFYTVNITSADEGGCSYSETIPVFSGAYPLDFDIVDSDSIVSCIGDHGSITIGNVIGDPDTTFIVQLIGESNVILETYELHRFEFEGGFTIDENNTDKLVAGKYYIKMIQNQSECAAVTAISEVINIYEPLAQLGFSVLDDNVSLADRPTGNIIGEVIPSGGDPYEVRIQLLEPVFEMNVTDIIAFNESRQWKEVTSTGDNLNKFPTGFDSLWAGSYEIRVRDGYGCEFLVEEYNIGYDQTIFIPNVFTPNDDGINDTFYIRNLPESGTSLVISNRNGFVIFKSDDYNYDTLWDGGDVADGIYYYTITMPSGDSYKGWIEKWTGARP